MCSRVGEGFLEEERRFLSRVLGELSWRSERVFVLPGGGGRSLLMWPCPFSHGTCVRPC